jgi:hypothetical protein
MSDKITHECGIAMVRLLKPLSYYQEKYGTPLWGFTKLFLLMEKQHNRGQDGAGVGCVKLDMPAGEPFMFRERCVKANPLDKIFKTLLQQYNGHLDSGVIHPEFTDTVKKNFDFGGELLLGQRAHFGVGQQPLGLVALGEERAEGGDLLDHRLQLGVFTAQRRQIGYGRARAQPRLEELVAGPDLVELVERDHPVLRAAMDAARPGAGSVWP